MHTILIIEDEQAIADTLRYAITSEGMQVKWVDSGNEAKLVLAADDISMCILDVGLPDCSGFELLKEIRQSNHYDQDIPVLMLTARNEEIDRIVGLEIGADDYVAKPFSPREVVARVKVILKRAQRSVPANKELVASSFVDNPEMCQIFYQGASLDLTKSEYSLLQALVQRPGKVFSRRQLIDRVWSSNHPSDDRVIDTHVKTLRAKLRQHNSQTEFIITHRGFGYSLEI